MIVLEKTAIRDIAKIYADTPLETLKAWQVFHVTDQAAPYLSKRFVDSRFAFTKTLSGVSELRPRWKRGASLIDTTLGELLGRTYVETYFPASSKAMMNELVANLKTAMAARIQKSDWMSADTKKAALEKLAKMDVMVGYPDKWRDYSKLKVDVADLYGNVERSAQFEWDYQLSDLGKPVDRKKWAMTPQTVNAYNGGLENKIVFPAGILQAPFFDPTADAAVNYGAIGAIIGHEISHGFDDQGRKIDSTGAVRDWWTKTDADRFDAQAKGFGAQYDTYEPVPGMHVNGQADDGREHRRSGGRADRARRVSRVARRQAGAGHRRTHRRSALLPGLRAGVAQQAARRCDAGADGVRPALAGQVPRHRPAAERRRVVRRVRRDRSASTS